MTDTFAPAASFPADVSAPEAVSGRNSLASLFSALSEDDAGELLRALVHQEHGGAIGADGVAGLLGDAQEELLERGGAGEGAGDLEHRLLPRQLAFERGQLIGRRCKLSDGHALR